tara:strand:- start:855 stop:1589 length:735 start_codon:yes stop_codon:yes gene_type:complete
MSGKVGSISTPIVVDGLVINMDAANRASYPKTGTTWTDTINGNNGTLTNGPVFDSANAGIIDFDGNDDHVITSINQTSFDFNTHTFSIWVKISSDDSFEPFGFLNAGNTTSYRLKLNTNSNNDNNSPGKVSFFGRGASGTIFAFEFVPSVNDGNWHNIVFVFSSMLNNNVTAYYDGAPFSTSTTRAGTVSMGTTSFPFFIGATNNRGSILRPLDGNIANISISNNILSASEVLQNYNALKDRFI